MLSLQATGRNAFNLPNFQRNSPFFHCKQIFPPARREIGGNPPARQAAEVPHPAVRLHFTGVVCRANPEPASFFIRGKPELSAAAFRRANAAQLALFS
jgi:hypothetical protein